MLEKLRDRDWLQQRYIEEKKSIYTIGATLDCSPGTVAQALKRCGIKARKGAPPKREPLVIACQQCGETFKTGGRTACRLGQRFCSRKCSVAFTSSSREVQAKRRAAWEGKIKIGKRGPDYHPDLKTCAARRRRRRRFGVGAEEYQRMLDSQGERCAVCGQKETRLVCRNSDRVTSLVIDHDHDTGKIRGLLCHRCNVAIGLVDDNCETLRRMIDYLEGHGRTCPHQLTDAAAAAV